MKERIHWSITTKLLLINIMIFAIFGAVFVVVRASFESIESSIETVIEQDVTQVINNAQLSRELNREFTETSLLIGTIVERDEQFKKRGDNLVNTLKTLMDKGIPAQLQSYLEDFLQKLRTLLDQGIFLQTQWQGIQGIDLEISSHLANLEDLLAEKLILFTMENKDSSSLNQISSLLPGYRDTLSQITISLIKLRQKYAVNGAAASPDADLSLEEQHPELFALFHDIGLRLRILLASDEELAQYGERLITSLETYQERVLKFYSTLQEFQQQTTELQTTENHILLLMRELDGQIVQTTSKIRGDIGNVIGKAKRIILGLAFIMVIILLAAWLLMRWMTRPLIGLSQSAALLADGNIRCDIHDVKYRDEIGMLSRSFRRLITYFQEMANLATEISHGNLDLEITPKSEYDVFGSRYRQMIAYLKNIVTMAEHVARGDLRNQITLRSEQDKLGSVFMQMQAGLIALIAEIRSGADYIAPISQQILGTTTQNFNALEKIGEAAEVTSSAMRQMNASAEEVRMNTEYLSSSVDETSASISQMISSIKHVADNSRKLSTFTDTTSTTVAQIVHSLENVAQQAEDSKSLSETTKDDATSGQQAVEQMIEKINAISQMTRNLSETIGRLEKRSLDIGTILDVINEVAEQTSMLSLNASIIAAQAGVHGRGFAVVANEIKELAGRVGTSTNEIAQIVKGVQRDSSDAVHEIQQGQQEVETGVVIAHQAGEALQKILQSAYNSSKVAAEIAVQVRRQTTASTHIAHSIHDVANMTTEITRATHEQEKNSAQLFTVVENMQALAMQVFQATKEQQQSTQHVSEFMEEVIDLVEESVPTVKGLAQTADELAVQSEKLTQQVERFMIPSKTS